MSQTPDPPFVAFLAISFTLNSALIVVLVMQGLWKKHPTFGLLAVFGYFDVIYAMFAACTVGDGGGTRIPVFMLLLQMWAWGEIVIRALGIPRTVSRNGFLIGPLLLLGVVWGSYVGARRIIPHADLNSNSTTIVACVLMQVITFILVGMTTAFLSLGYHTHAVRLLAGFNALTLFSSALLFLYVWGFVSVDRLASAGAWGYNALLVYWCVALTPSERLSLRVDGPLHRAAKILPDSVLLELTQIADVKRAHVGDSGTKSTLHGEIVRESV